MLLLGPQDGGERKEGQAEHLGTSNRLLMSMYADTCTFNRIPPAKSASGQLPPPITAALRVLSLVRIPLDDFSWLRLT
jgi:hypothetical protein